MRRKAIALAVLGSLSGCGLDYDPADQAVQRDVYTRLEDCMADWGDAQLCTQQQPQQVASSGGGGGTYVHTYYHGPEYYPGSRQTYRNGQVITPQRASAVSTTAPRAPSAAFKSAVSQSSASRGGFGSSGRSASSGSFGG